ncbi:hypothetical protein [Novosphingobium sp. P6W]|uniref:hypothetical protein n=1 Tax=Novosphingobium sp. P6W TaxID=1609758 RepID=UPI0005C2F300|nr:hypothetical protein [Novosphingobium sp. P6W]AXB80701.1 hypothetical protein TQ38_029545 [Novosphingobium sp. P6W]KIS29517.1 hypothetical protein TQ38_27705 [Novosphingobium sp. P6W]
MPTRYWEANGSGEAWADILARRSPEGRAVADELHRAEEAALAIQERIIAAMREKQDFTDDFCAFEAAIAEVDRMRSEVYRMVRQ